MKTEKGNKNRKALRLTRKELTRKENFVNGGVEFLEEIDLEALRDKMGQPSTH